MISFLTWLETLNDEERSVFQRIYADFGKRLKYLAWSLTHNDADAEDLVSTVFLRIMQYKDRFLNADDKEIYRLLVIYTRSVYFNKLKKERRFGMSSLDEPIPLSDDEEEEIIKEYEDEDSPNGLEEVLTKERNKKIARYIESLGTPISEIIFLTYYEDHTSAEVGEILGLNPSTVRTLLKKGRDKIRKEMERYLSDENY